MVNSMNPASLCRIVRNSLDSQTGLKSPYDAIACLSHACMLSAGFTFVGLGEDHLAESRITTEDLSALPTEWNSAYASTYAFRYQHAHVSSDYVLRINRIGTKVMIFGATGDDDKTTTLEIGSKEYTDSECYPWTPENHTRSLTDAYVSMSRIKDFSNLFIKTLLQKTIPAQDEEEDSGTVVQKLVQPLEGRASQQVRPADPSTEPLVSQPRPGYDPLRVPPRPNPVPSDWPPEFEDEHQLQGPRGSIYGGGLGGIGGIGADDLRPPGIDAMNPFGRSRGHRGMHPTPEDFFPHRGDESIGGDFPRGPPAGARYDPVFPGDRNGFRGGRALGRGGFNQFNGGGLDNDAHDSMFG